DAPHGAPELPAAHRGHPDIGDYGVWIEFQQLKHRFAPVARAVHHIALVLQQSREGADGVVVVVRDEDPDAPWPTTGQLCFCSDARRSLDPDRNAPLLDSRDADV